ncbi:signal peptidase I [Alkalinema sp. FACHB-956]|uniref:signal peptidase I n=1 Tax=Alkalinema sp. FACHB-956 TaxID=2692768 RepID=UPI00168A0A1B|nr:signal peptidase I [Alkalinema sp. FACHB-956]MBD2328796.1 signal peptidase I [Alkalinema sp. FACHB-956]
MANNPNSSNSDRTDRWKSVWENIQIVVIALIVALLVRTFIAEPRFIPSDSMVPTLLTDDRLIVEKVSYWFHPPQTGDIVVFSAPEPLQRQGYGKDQALIKRIIGQPGNRVGVYQGKVSIDGQPIAEPYIAEPPAYNCPSQVPLVPRGQDFCSFLFSKGLKEGESFQVPDNYYFVMGDNRNNSNDSHAWGFLPRQNIIGRAWVRFFPFNRLGDIYSSK